MDLTVIIPNRRDPGLLLTLAGIASTCLHDMPEVIVVADGPDEREYPRWVKRVDIARPHGPGRARHIGILAATHDAVMTVDAHMAFQDNDWAARMLSAICDFPKDVLCCRTANMLDLRGDPARPVNWIMGADILWKAELKGYHRSFFCAPRYEAPDAGMEHVREVPCLVGASYGFSRAHYIHGLRAPWQYLTGWGLDEEILSTTNWLCGNRTLLLDIEVGHCNMGGKDFSAKETASVWGARFWFCQMMPFSPAAERELMEWTMMAPLCLRSMPLVRAVANEVDVSPHRAFLTSQARTMDDFLKHWNIGKESVFYGHEISNKRAAA